MREMIDTVQQIRNEDIPEHSLARLQAAVKENAGKRERRRAWQPAVIGAIVLLIVLMNGVWRATHRTQAPSEVRMTKMAQPQEFDDASEEMIALATEMTQIPPPLKVKLYTEDPNVVIYWFGD